MEEEDEAAEVLIAEEEGWVMRVVVMGVLTDMVVVVERKGCDLKYVGMSSYEQLGLLYE